MEEESSTVRRLNLDPRDLPATRSPAQKAQDQILEAAEGAAREALAKAEEAISWLEVLTPVAGKSAPVYLRQLLAEILELRRTRQ